MIRLAVRDGTIVQTVRIEAGKAFIGRAATNSILLEDPAASRKHCMLRIDEAGAELLDLNSRHGLTVNGERKRRTTLSLGDVIQIGDATLTVDEIGGPAATLAAFGGYLDDDDTAYVLRPIEGEETAPAVAVTSVPTAESGPGDDGWTSVRKRFEHSFADDFYAAVRRTPGWIASAALHALLLLVIWEINFIDVPSVDDAMVVNARSLTDAERADEDASPKNDRPEDVFAEVEDVEDIDEPDIKEVLPDTGPESNGPSDAEPDQLPTEIGPGADLFSTRTLGRKTKVAVDIGENEEFGKGNYKDANHRASQFVKRGLEGGGGRDAKLLRRFPKGEIKVLEGQYDKVEDVLSLYDIQHTRIAERELHRLKLDDTSVLFVNCSNAQIPPKAVEAIAAWVKSGGYLFTTDWALDHLIEKGFPGTIKALRTKSDSLKQTENETVSVQVPRRPHFLLEGTGLDRGDAMWWLEDSSYPFRIVKSSVVESLVRSSDLKRHYGSEHVAVTFRWGSGRVVHVIGHYLQKEGNLRGTFAMHRLITNFLVASVKRR